MSQAKQVIQLEIGFTRSPSADLRESSTYLYTGQISCIQFLDVLQHLFCRLQGRVQKKGNNVGNIPTEQDNDENKEEEDDDDDNDDDNNNNNMEVKEEEEKKKKERKRTW